MLRTHGIFGWYAVVSGSLCYSIISLLLHRIPDEGSIHASQQMASTRIISRVITGACEGATEPAISCVTCLGMVPSDSNLRHTHLLGG